MELHFVLVYNQFLKRKTPFQFVGEEQILLLPIVKHLNNFYLHA